METGSDYASSRNQARMRLRQALSDQDYLLEVFGDTLAQAQQYKDLDGLDALRYYLMLKHGWLPREVRALSTEDLRFALHQEMQGWTLPAALRP